MRPSRPLLAALAALSSGCAALSGLFSPAPTTYAGTLGNGQPANVVAIASHQTVTLGPKQPALFALASHQDVTSGVQLSLSLDGSPPSNPLTASRFPGGARPVPGFEPTLTRRMARLPYARANGYHLLDATPKLEDQASFWVIDDDSDGPDGDHQVQARTVYVGSHCVVMVDTASKDLDARAKEMGQAFDTSIYDTDSRVFGAPLTHGGDGRITLLLSPQVGDNGRDNTIGYFTPRDLLSPKDAPDDPEVAHSNQREMLYIAADVAKTGQAADYLGTLAHEFQHLINATHKLYGGAKDPQPEDVWLDEGLAMYAMQANGFGLDANASVLLDHVTAYMERPERYSLTDWDRDPDQSAYGAVFLFITYVADRFGADLLPELVAASEVGTANMEARLAKRGAHLDQVFDDWVGADLLAGTGMSADPRYGYHSIDVNGTYGGRPLHGVNVSTVTGPGSGAIPMLPYSAHYLLMQGRSDGQYQVDLQGAPVGGLLITPRS